MEAEGGGRRWGVKDRGMLPGVNDRVTSAERGEEGGQELSPPLVLGTVFTLDGLFAPFIWLNCLKIVL